MSGIHQFIPLIHRGDAVGRHTLRLRDAARARGFSSDIFVDITPDDTSLETKSILAYSDLSQKDDVLVYQFATASYMAEWLSARAETLVINYHNITPSDLIAPWDTLLAFGQRVAEEELQMLVTRTTLAVADSVYNESHLIDAGFRRTAVVPPSAALTADTITERAQARASERQPGSGARWLSVGRLAPNKAVEDAIAALAITRAHHDPKATLVIIGKPATAAYDDALRSYVADLGLNGAVTFAGYASDETVATAYAQADVLVVTSDHEGFCVPVVEAMSIGLPVVAFDQGAVPDVLGHGGVLVSSKDPYHLASVIGQLLDDRPRRAALQEAARTQLVSLELDSAADRFITLLTTLTVGASA